MNRSTDERGQVLSSLVAVLAVVAIVGGLLVLFGTRGDDVEPAAQSQTPGPSRTPAAADTPSPSAVPTSGQPTSAPTPTDATTPTAPASTEPTTPATEPTEEPTEVPTPRVTVPPSERPAVEVYNNTNRRGLAEDVGNRARQAGWTVSGADNWHGKIAGSTVYYPAGMQSEAAQLARDLGIGRIKDALSNMKKDRLTVILTTDYAG